MFYNYFKVFYKFICEEDSFRIDVKIILGIIVCLNLIDKLKYIFCVFYIRRDLDKVVWSFLKRFFGGFLDDVVDRGEGGRDVKCYFLDWVC